MDLTRNTELDILRTLAVQVRMASRGQVARGWFAGCQSPDQEAEKVLASLHRKGLIEPAIIEVRTAGEALAPVFEWQSDGLEPEDTDLEEIADQLHLRWSEEFVPLEVYSISRLTANLFGVRNHGLGRPCEWSHDYRLTEVLLHYRERNPSPVARWLGESAFPKWGKQVKRMKDPDAFLTDEHRRIERVIEVAGKYSASHLRDFHRHCAGGAYLRLIELAEQSGVAGNSHPYCRGEIGYELW